MSDDILVLLLKIALAPPVFIVSFAIGYCALKLAGIAMAILVRWGKTS